MTTVKVSPKLDSSQISHDIGLSHDATKIGLMFAGGPSALQHIPKTNPVRAFSETMRDWIGGRGRRYFREDNTAYFDARDAWSMTSEKLFNAPEYYFGTGMLDEQVHWGGGNVEWIALTGIKQHIATAFTASATYNIRNVMLKVRQVGEPGTLTVGFYSYLAGDLETPTLLGSQTLAATSGDWIAKDLNFLLASTAVSSGTKYYVTIYGASTDSDANHWEVGMDSAGALASYKSADGSGWTAYGYDLWYRITQASPNRRLWFFNHLESLYALSVTEEYTSPTLWINGDRGKATGGSTTTLEDTDHGIGGTWTTNLWAGWWVKIIAGKGKGQCSKITSSTSTTLTLETTWRLAPSTTSEYVIYGGGRFSEITGHGMTKGTCRPASANKVAYFCQGTAINMRRMQVDYTDADCHAWDDTYATYRYDFVEAHQHPSLGLRIFLARADTCAMGYVTPPTWGGGTAQAYPVKGGTVGTPDADITSVKGSGDKLYIGKTTGIWWLDETTPKMFTLNIKDVPEPTNLLGITTQGDTVFFGYGDSFGYMIAGQHKDLLNYRAGYEGTPEGRGGYVSCAITVLGWVFYSIDGGEDGISSVWAWNGIGMHEIWRAWKAGIRVRDIFWQPNQGTNGFLWIDADAQPVYIPFPLRRSNPLLDSEMVYRSDWHLITGIFDVEKENLYKMFSELQVVSENLTSDGIYIDFDYQINENVETDNWIYLGQINTSPFEILNMKLGEVQKIRLRIRAHTNSATTPAVLMLADLLGEVSEPPKYQWIGTFKVGEEQETYDGQMDFKPNYILDWLTEAHNKMLVLHMDGCREADDNKEVTCSLPADVVDTLEKGQWDGRISVQFREV